MEKHTKLKQIIRDIIEEGIDTSGADTITLISKNDEDTKPEILDYLNRKGLNIVSEEPNDFNGTTLIFELPSFEESPQEWDMVNQNIGRAMNIITRRNRIRDIPEPEQPSIIIEKSFTPEVSKSRYDSLRTGDKWDDIRNKNERMWTT
jgi:hypothetical protein